ncbi:peptidase M16 [Campylobacter pinnipediorum subsp. pinnipediorum]|uniref:Peptidase M16 n=1 Tax=Campylobacter pinnipediorum subsp. pinnipediorum TaxID=1660067 RepID=A0AAX0LAN0_9BACT|nr:pitrilysin family protein [Campylobacter pinnipediorum]OPA78907.1 peptidase M16 [Campylobacter pinnipediorum subsp. pinnipediorum]
MEILHLKTKNDDIPVIFESSKELSVAYLKLIFKASGVCMQKTSGLAKLSAMILNEGEKDMGSSLFAKELEKRAISMYASAGFETFTIEINCLKEHFNFTLDMLKKLIKNPNISEQSLEKCKNITLGEIANNQNDNDYLARCGLMQILYPDTNLATPSIGTQESIDSIKLQDIKDYLNDALDLKNLFIVFGGDVNKDEISSLQDITNVIKSNKKLSLEKLQTSQRGSVKEIIKQSEQAYIYFGSPYNVADDEKYMASVATFILGEGGFGARLMEEIRVKRGLAYSAYARNIFNLSHSQIFGYLQTKNESKDEAMSVVREEFLKFTTHGVSDKELEQAKKFLLGSLPLRLETLFKRFAIAQGEFYQGKEIGDFLKELENIKNLKLNDLNSFIKQHDEITKLSFCVLRNEI